MFMFLSLSEKLYLWNPFIDRRAAAFLLQINVDRLIFFSLVSVPINGSARQEMSYLLILLSLFPFVTLHLFNFRNSLRITMNLCYAMRTNQWRACFFRMRNGRWTTTQCTTIENESKRESKKTVTSCYGIYIFFFITGEPARRNTNSLLSNLPFSQNGKTKS